MRDFLSHTYDLLLRGGAAVLGFLHGAGSREGRFGVLLLCLMAADFLTGLAAGVLERRKAKSGGQKRKAPWYKRLLRKAIMLLVLALAAVLDWLIHDGNTMFFTAACWMYIGTEALSLLEHLARCGVPVPAGIKRRLEQFISKEEPGLPAQAAQVAHASLSADEAPVSPVR